MPEGHHGGTAAILGAVGGYRPATDGIRRGRCVGQRQPRPLDLWSLATEGTQEHLRFESPANRGTAIKQGEKETTN